MKKLLVLVLVVVAVYFAVTGWVLPFMEAQNLRSKYSEAALAAKVFAAENSRLQDLVGTPLKVGLHEVLEHADDRVTLKQELAGGRKKATAIAEVGRADGSWRVSSYLVTPEGGGEPVQLVD